MLNDSGRIGGSLRRFICSSKDASLANRNVARMLQKNDRRIAKSGGDWLPGASAHFFAVTGVTRYIRLCVLSQ